MASKMFKTLREDFEAFCRENDPTLPLFKRDVAGPYENTETIMKYDAWKRAYQQYASFMRAKKDIDRPFIVLRCSPVGIHGSHKPHIHNRADDAITEANRLQAVHGAQFMVMAKVFLTPKLSLPTTPVPGAEAPLTEGEAK